MTLTLLKRKAQGWQTFALRVEPSTGTNYYGVTVIKGYFKRQHRQWESETLWFPAGTPPIDVLVTLLTPQIHAGFARRGPRSMLYPLTDLEATALRRSRRQGFGLQIALFCPALG